jgi:hypothetical protein
VVPIPGEAPWARAAHGGSSAPPSGAAAADDADAAAGARGAKRGRGDGASSPATAPAAQSPSADDGAVSTAAAPVAALDYGTTLSLHRPLVADADPPVLVRIYSSASRGAAAADEGGDGGESSPSKASSTTAPSTVGLLPRINDVVEVIGLLTVDPDLTHFSSSPGAGGDAADADAAAAAAGDVPARPRTHGDDDGMDEDDGDNEDDHIMHALEANNPSFARRDPPPSLVPRVQGLLVRRLAPSYPVLQPPVGPREASGSFALQPAGVDDAPGTVGGGGPSRSPSRGAAVLAAATGVPATAAGQAPSSSSSPGGGAAAVPPAAIPSDAAVLRELSTAAAGRLASAAVPPGGGAAGGGAGALASYREGAVAYLTTALGGDALAAEYVLLHALSCVVSRNPSTPSPEGLVLGKMSLCLSGLPEVPVTPQAAVPAAPVGAGAGSAAAPPSYKPLLPLEEGASPAGRAVAAALAAVLPRGALLPLRIDLLNSLPFYPIRGDAAPKLASGLLQLPQGTHVTVDETTLASGQLGPQGVRNLHALQGVARAAVLPYAFPYHQAHWAADLPVLVLAPRRPLVATDAEVRLSPSAAAALASGAGGSAGGALADPAFLGRVRAYLAAARGLPFALDAPAAEAVQNDWVAARKAQAAAAAAADEPPTAPARPGRVSEDDLHRWLTLGRLAALSFGEGGLSPQRWAWVKALEAARVGRLVGAPASSS